MREGDRPLAEDRIGDADQRRLGHAGLRRQRLLDVARVPQAPGHLDELRPAAAQGHAALRVEKPEIAGAQVAAAGRGFRLVRLAPVAGHEAAGERDLADLARRQHPVVGAEDEHLLVGQRRPDAPEPRIVRLRFRVAEADEAAEFALAVALDQRQAEFVAPGRLERRRHRTAAGETEAQRQRRGAAAAGFLQHVVEDRRIGHEARRPASTERVVAALTGPEAHHVDRRADGERRQQVGDELVGAGERGGAEGDVARSQPQALADAAGSADGGLVAQAGALRLARRARGVGQVGDGGLVAGIGRGGQGCRQHLRQGEGAVLRPVHAQAGADRSDRLAGRGHLRRHVVGVDHCARRVVGEIVGQFVGKLHVHQRGDGADPPCSQHRHDVVEPVMGEDRDTIPLSHAEIVQGAGHAVHGIDGPGIGQAAVAIDPVEGGPLGMALGAEGEETMHQHGGAPVVALFSGCGDRQPQSRSIRPRTRSMKARRRASEATFRW